MQALPLPLQGVYFFHHQTQKPLYSSNNPLPTYRWNKCVSGASSEYKGFGYAAGHKYILEYFDEEAKDTVGHMVENLISAFKELVGESVWMDVETRVLF